MADLVGLSSSGLSDPIVFVEMCGQIQKTKVAHEVTGHFYDEVFYFNLKEMKKEQLNQAYVKISVFDHNWFRSNQLIGVYQVHL